MPIQRVGLTDKDIVLIREHLASLHAEAETDGKPLTQKRLEAEYNDLARVFNVPLEVIQGNFHADHKPVQSRSRQN